VTGPTGSGKATTLATMLSILNEPTRKILTIEDPVEYEIPRINQSQVKPSIGLTFASAMRSFVPRCARNRDRATDRQFRGTKKFALKVWFFSHVAELDASLIAARRVDRRGCCG
jgi:energy-coupling factor transporter ATP-binding protein EcfA2